VPPTFGANNYAWSVTPGGITQNGPTPFKALQFPTVGTYEVCVTPSGPQLGCFDVDSSCITVNVTQLPVPAGYESGIVCTGDYYVAGNGEVFYFGGTFDLVYNSWQGCDSIVRLTLDQKISDFKVIVQEVCAGECVEWAGETVCETGTYDEVLQNQFGCDSTNQLLLISVPIETVIKGADTLDCITTSITLTSVGSVYAANPKYTWRRGNTVVGSNPTLNVTQGGTYSLEIKSVVAGDTCSDIATVLIIQNTTQPQNVVATGGNATCLTTQVTLMGSSSTPGVTYSWAGPNGFSSNLQNPTVSAQGNYVLTVTGTNGCTRTATAVVSENKVPPTVAASTNGTLNCNASSVLLSGAGSSVGSQYTYNWTTTDGNILSGETTLTPTVNQGGTYLLTVTNANNGCTSTASTIVVQLLPVTSQISSTNVPCFGGATGSATVSANGGNGSYTYQWSNGQTTATAANLTAGNYSVVVTDGNGCTSSQSVVISQPPNLVVNAAATPQTIFGVDNGTATADPTGGFGTYTYLWSNGETTQTITDLAPANYMVVVTDENGCTASQTVTVAANDCIVKVNVEKTDVSCAGANDGTATLNLDNATPPFIFAWSNGATTQSVTGLAGGTYEVSSTDANGCEVVSTIFIEEAQPLHPNATATGLSAYNSNDGTASANPTGGVAPYSFLWDNGETTETIGNLPIGDYTVVVTDENGCESEQTVTVNQYNCTLAATIIFGGISCNGESDGQATLAIAGGNAPFTYEWSTGQTTATITGLSAGTYIGTATDGSGCPAIAEATLVAPAPLGVAIIEEIEAECGASDGSLTVVGTGGTADYTYLWQSGETTQTVAGLTAGVYTLAITDANDCTNNFDVILGTNDDVPPVATTLDITVALDANGIAVILPSAVDNGSTDDCLIASFNLDQSSFNCNDLGENTVTLSVTDVGNNTTSATAIVTVVDNTPPVLNLQDISLTIPLSGVIILTPQMVDNGSSDNCGTVTLTLSQTDFGCDTAGPNNVTVTATDASGNTSTATVVVTIIENTPPQINCPGATTLSYCDPVASFNVTATDNCVGDVTITQTSGLPSGSTYPVGNTTVSFTATDVSGNTTECSFVITVPPTMAVGLTHVNVSCFGENDGSAIATPSGGILPYTYLWSNNATTPSVNGLNAGNYTVSVTDAGGCTVIQSVTITQPTNLTTSLVDIVNATNNQANGSIDVTVSGGVAPYTFVWKNAAGATIGTSEDINGLPPGTFTLQVTDANGCVSQSGYTIQNSTGTAEVGLDSHILLYPNPTSGEVTLELTGLAIPENLQVGAFDVTGRQVLQTNTIGTKLVLNFSDKPSGVYLLKIVVGSEMLTKRLVVNK